MKKCLMMSALPIILSFVFTGGCGNENPMNVCNNTEESSTAAVKALVDQGFVTEHSGGDKVYFEKGVTAQMQGTNLILSKSDDKKSLNNAATVEFGDEPTKKKKHGPRVMIYCRCQASCVGPNNCYILPGRNSADCWGHCERPIPFCSELCIMDFAAEPAQ